MRTSRPSKLRAVPSKVRPLFCIAAEACLVAVAPKGSKIADRLTWLKQSRAELCYVCCV